MFHRARCLHEQFPTFWPLYPHSNNWMINLRGLKPIAMDFDRNIYHLSIKYFQMLNYIIKWGYKAIILYLSWKKITIDILSQPCFVPIQKGSHYCSVCVESCSKVGHSYSNFTWRAALDYKELFKIKIDRSFTSNITNI